MEQPVTGAELDELLGRLHNVPTKPSYPDGPRGMHDTIEAFIQRNTQGAKQRQDGSWEIIDKNWLKMQSQFFEGTYNRGTGKTTVWPTFQIPLLDLPTINKDLPDFPTPPPEGPHVPPGIPIVPGSDPKILCRIFPEMCYPPQDIEEEPEEELSVTDRIEATKCTCGIKPDGTCKECLAKGGEIAWSIFKQLGIS